MRYPPCLQIDGGRDGVGYREIVPGPVVWDFKERDCATLLTVENSRGITNEENISMQVLLQFRDVFFCERR